MARIRTIKPEFFRHEGLFEAEKETGLPLRVAFPGLWTSADREGRFKWKPRQLKLDCLPFDDVDFSRVLDALATRGFIVKYALNGEEFGFIPSWNDHQIINNRESDSKIPPPEECSIESTTSTRDARVPDATGTPLVQVQGEGKGKEGKGTRVEHADCLPGFSQFWKAWPSGDRKQAKGKCLDAWKKSKAENEAALIIAHVERMKASEDWRKQSGQFVPSPLVYLNQRRWEGAESLQEKSDFTGCI